MRQQEQQPEQPQQQAAVIPNKHDTFDFWIRQSHQHMPPMMPQTSVGLEM
jgi:hypothetical protein